MTTPLQIRTIFSPLSSPQNHPNNKPTTFAPKFSNPFPRIASFHYTTNTSIFSLPVCNWSTSKLKIETLCKNRFELRVLDRKVSFLAAEKTKNVIFWRKNEQQRSKRGVLVRFSDGFGFNGGDGKKRSKRVVLVRFNDGFGFNGGGGGGGNNNRALGNLVLAIVLTYFTMTGQLGWFFDAVVSIWLLAVIVPIAGLGAFLWWAGRDIVRSSCPNCGNDFQVFKSMLNDEVQLCPYCSQPFSVVGDEFVRDPVTFSNQTNPFDKAFSDFSPRTKKGKDSSKVVDVEAEIRDAE